MPPRFVLIFFVLLVCSAVTVPVVIVEMLCRCPVRGRKIKQWPMAGDNESINTFASISISVFGFEFMCALSTRGYYTWAQMPQVSTYWCGAKIFQNVESIN